MQYKHKPNVYTVFAVLHENGKHHYNELGKFLVASDEVTHLHDNYGVLHHLVPQGLDNGNLERTLNRLNVSSYIKVKDISSIDSPDFDLIQDLPNDGYVPRYNSGSWHVQIPGIDGLHQISAKDGQFVMNGQPLDEDEIAYLLDSNKDVQNGIIMNQELNKSILDFEVFFDSLEKKDPDTSSIAGEPDLDPEQALQHLQGLVDKGQLPPAVEKALRRHVFEDSLTGLGNRYSHEQRMKKGHTGPHMALDLNNLKTLNDQHGHEAGDNAIRAAGQAMREASKKVPSARVSRTGGDEFVATFDSPEDAHLFSRHLTEHLDKVPLINGTHKLSISGGIGHDLSSADKALYEAKKNKFKPEGLKLDPHGAVDFRNSTPAFESHNMPSFIYSTLDQSKAEIPASTSVPKQPSQLSLTTK